MFKNPSLCATVKMHLLLEYNPLWDLVNVITHGNNSFTLSDALNDLLPKYLLPQNRLLAGTIGTGQLLAEKVTDHMEYFNFDI